MRALLFDGEEALASAIRDRAEAPEGTERYRALDDRVRQLEELLADARGAAHIGVESEIPSYRAALGSLTKT